MGGTAFGLSMVWAQIFPFVALQFFESNEDESAKEAITVFLVGSFTMWLLLNIALFCTIDLSYSNTFFGTKTASQYTVNLYHETNEDSLKFVAVFNNRLSYTTAINEDVKEWIASNIARWKEEGEPWFKIEMIPDDYLPRAVFEEEGGAKRRRSDVSLSELVSPINVNARIEVGEKGRERGVQEMLLGFGRKKEKWKILAEEIYALKSTNYKSNFAQVSAERALRERRARYFNRIAKGKQIFF